MSRFGEEWSYQPGYDTSAPAQQEIPYYLARPEGAVYDETGTIPDAAVPRAIPSSEPAATSVRDWFGMGKDVARSFVDIFGRQVTPSNQYPLQPMPSQSIPVWGWALIGVAAVAAVGLTIRSLRPSSKRRYSGRRRSRR